MNELTTTGEQFLSLWSNWMVQSSIQAAVIGLIVIVLVSTLRMSSQLKQALLVVALLRFAFPPLVGFPLGLFNWAPSMNRPVSYTRRFENPPDVSPVVEMNHEASNSVSVRSLPTGSPEPARKTIQWTAESEYEATVGSQSQPTGKEETNNPAAMDRGVRWNDPFWFFLAYVLGVVAAATPIGIQYLRLRSVIQSSQRLSKLPKRICTRQRISVLESDRISSPFSTGCFFPVIMIPAGLPEKLTPAEMKIVLEHESMHHQRGDLWLNAIQLLVTRLWWFHPIAWVVSWLLRSVREDCCDDILLSRGLTKDQDYCAILMKVATWTRHQTLAASLVLSMARSHPLGKRLRRIMNSAIIRSDRLSRYGWLVAITFACFALPGMSDTSKKERLPNDESQNPAPPYADRMVSGLIKTADGRPIHDAKIWIHSVATRGDEMLASGKSDREGRFRVPCSRHPLSNAIGSKYTFIAYHRRAGLGAISSRQFPDREIAITIDRNIKADLTIANPDGTPAVNVIVKPAYVGIRDSNALDQYANVSLTKDLQDQFARNTDHEGKVTFYGIAPDEYAVFHLLSPSFGQQNVYLSKGESKGKLRLGETGRVKGRILLPRGTSMDEFKQQITLVTNWSPSIDVTPRWNGIAQATPDADGKFVVSAILEGPVKVIARDDGDSEWIAQPPNEILVAAGRTTEIKIPVVRAMTVVGKAIEQDSKKPIPNVDVELSAGGGASRWVRTDKNGEFRANLKPGFSGHIRYDAPPSYVQNTGDFVTGMRQLKVPIKGDSFRLKPVQFALGREIQGKLTDEMGKPKSTIRVNAMWRSPEQKELQVETISDQHGHFKLVGVDSRENVTVSAWEKGVVVARTELSPQDRMPVLLRISPFEMVTLSGRFLDENHRPLRNFGFRIIQMVPGPNSIALCPVDSGRTDEKGHFHSNKVFPRIGKFQVEAVRNGASFAETDELRREASGQMKFADLIVSVPARHAKTTTPPHVGKTSPPKSLTKRYSGRIVDANGEPVAHAEVIGWSRAQRIKTTSDERGAFSLPTGKEVWLIVKAKGFRIRGGYYLSDAATIEIPLERLNKQQNTPRIKPIPELKPTPKQWEDIRERFRTFGETVMASGVSPHQFELQRMAPWIDAEYANRLLFDKRFDISKMKFSGDADHLAWHQNHVRTLILQQFATRGEVERALSIGQAITDPQVNSHLEIAKSTKGSPGVRTRQLTLAHEMAKKLDDGFEKVMSLTEIANQFLKLQKKHVAIEILNEAQQSLRKLSGGQKSYAAEAVVPVLARCAPSLAVALAIQTEFANDGSKARVYSELAWLLHETRSQDAEYLFEEAPKHVSRTDAVLLAARMAVVDIDGAIEIAEAIEEPPLRCYALGMMAYYLAVTDNALAQQVLHRAFEELEGLVESGYQPGRSIYDPFTAGLAMLLEVEGVAPGQLDQYFWRVVSWRRNISYGRVTRLLGNHGEANSLRLSDPVMAAFVSRYDRELAKKILIPADDQELDLGLRFAPDFFFVALATIDPVAASEAVSELPSRTAREQERKLEEWQRIARVLSKTGRSRWHWIRDTTLQYATPDHLHHD